MQGSEFKIPEFVAPAKRKPSPCREADCDNNVADPLRDYYCPAHKAEVEEREREVFRLRAAEKRALHVHQTLTRVTRDYVRMSGWSFDTYPTDERGQTAKAQARDWFDTVYDEEPLTVLYITGPVGAGKTGLAWSTMRHALVSDNWTVDFANVRQLLSAARKSYSDNTTDPLDGLNNVNLLVLDDLGAERPTEWALETLATIIEERYQRGRYTIVTTNYTPAALVERLGTNDPILGQRIVSRLMESAKQIRLDGPDRRLKA